MYIYNVIYMTYRDSHRESDHLIFKIEIPKALKIVFILNHTPHFLPDSIYIDANIFTEKVIREHHTFINAVQYTFLKKTINRCFILTWLI